MFRHVERNAVTERLQQGFFSDGKTGIAHARQAVTEQGNTPDFLFPGAAGYRDPAFPAARLTMLAAKATCKERWRQILPEAARIPRKHLATLEPRISAAQTDQMAAADVQLVVPAALHASYAPTQRNWLWSIAGFVDMVLERQR